MTRWDWVVITRYDGKYSVTGPTDEYTAKRIADERLQDGYDLAEAVKLGYIDNTPY